MYSDTLKTLLKTCKEPCFIEGAYLCQQKSLITKTMLMKKILLLLTVMLAAWNSWAAETATTLIDVSDSPVAINWSKEASKTVEASALTTARVGDFIQVTVVGTGNMQLTLRNSSSTSVINTARFFLLDDGETTAVSTPSRNPLTVNQYYDLQGRRVAQPTRGLYIVNGKKVVIK